MEPPLSVQPDAIPNGRMTGETKPTLEVAQDVYCFASYTNGIQLQSDAVGHVCNQGTATGQSKVEQPSILSSLKNKIFGITPSETGMNGTAQTQNGHSTASPPRQLADANCASEGLQTDFLFNPSFYTDNDPGGEDQVEFPIQAANGGRDRDTSSPGPVPVSRRQIPSATLMGPAHPANEEVAADASTPPSLSQHQQIPPTNARDYYQTVNTGSHISNADSSSSLVAPVLRQEGPVMTTSLSMALAMDREQEDKMPASVSPPQMPVATAGAAHHERQETPPVTGERMQEGALLACRQERSKPTLLKSGTPFIVAGVPAHMEHALAKVKKEKTMSRARAWEESAKAKAQNRFTRDESKISAWESTMKAKADARMRKAEESLERLKAKHLEIMKNEVAAAHRSAEESRAMVEARRAEEFVKVEETASKFRATGKMPRKFLCMHA